MHELTSSPHPPGAGRVEAILGSAAFAVNRFAAARAWESVADEVLARLGEAAEVSRVYVFENTVLPDGSLAMSQRFEWAAAGTRATIDDPDNQGYPYAAGYEEHAETLRHGGVVVARASEVSGMVAADLAAEGILSMVLVPVFVDDAWWGYLGFDDCAIERAWTSVEIEALRAAAGILGAAIYRDRLDHELRRTEAWLKSHIESIPAVTYIEYTDADHGLGYVDAFVSPQIEPLLGYSPDEWLAAPEGSLWSQVVHPDDRQPVEELAARTSATGEPFVAEYRLRARDGRWVWIRDEAHLVHGDDDLPPFWHGVMIDITARKEAEEQVAFLAYHDSLTGLANRAMLEELLEPALARARRHNRCVALLFMDLDDFKTVNDVLGHDVGDLLLKQVASRLSRVVRETDVLARQGGDEFLVMIPDLQPEEGFDDADGALRVAEAMAERIHAVMRTPFQLGEREVNTSASIGISIFPTDAPDARALLKNSDAAMYDSKKTRHGGYSVYAESEGDPLTRLSFTHRLREAVRNERWALHYQPMVSLADGTIAGVEALLRWRRPKGDLISPSEFLPLAEELGLLEAIGEWVLEELCRQAGAWRDAGLEIPVSFNLSPRQLWQPDLASKLSSTLDAAGIDPSRVIVEISESTAATDPARTQRVLWALHEAGLQLAIDDFGTGYSPPARLKHLPVDILKIDQPLVRDLPDDPEIGGFVQAVIGFAEGLDIRSLAEGIETDAQRRYLADKGCTLGQGYLFSRPVPGADVLELARRGGGVLSSS